MADTQQDEQPYRLAGPEAMDAWRQSVDQTSSPDIGSLVTGGDKGLLSGYQDLYAKKSAEDRSLTSAADRRMAQDQARMDAMFKAEGVSAAELPKPWNAEKEHAKFEHNPIEGFGSVGGLFAMVASAFTKAPMENAINGMAGAINSIKAGDEAAYERAHQAWQENTKLALERFKTQHELYSDAMSLMDHDMAASDAKIRNAATRFGDSQMLMLAEHGMVKEMFELQASRAQAAEQMQELAERTTIRDFQKTAISAAIKNLPQTGDKNQDKLLQATTALKILGKDQHIGTAEQEAIGQAVMTTPPGQPLIDKLIEIHHKFSTALMDPRKAAYQEMLQQWQEENPGKQPSPDVQQELLTKAGLARAGGTGTSSQAVKAKAIEQIIEEHRKASKEIGIADAEREYNERRQTPTAHDKFMADAQYQKAERMESAMDEMDQLLLKHKFITGIGGTLTRPVEALGNILGSNETDRKQFQRVATELKEWGQSVMNDRSGRPLSSEAHDAAVIFAGLNPGDTGPNTIRAIAELRPVIKTIKEQIKARGQGRGPVSSTGSETPSESKPTSSQDAPWMNDPVKP